MSMDEDTEVDSYVDRHRVVDDHVINVVILRVPESEKYPEGWKYRMHFGTRDGETIVRYDNSHGVHERHSIGDADPEHIEFPGPDELLARFERDVREHL